MSLYEFTALTIDQRAEAIWDKGVYIHRAFGQNHAYQLYSMREFYAEVVLDLKLNCIIEVTGFKRGERLEKYLDYIGLDYLLGES